MGKGVPPEAPRTTNPAVGQRPGLVKHGDKCQCWGAAPASQTHLHHPALSVTQPPTYLADGTRLGDGTYGCSKTLSLVSSHRGVSGQDTATKARGRSNGNAV